MGKKTTVQSNDPWAPAQPYIIQNLADTKSTFDQNQPKLQAAATQQQNAYGRLAPGAEAGIAAGQTLTNDTINGKYLTGNPYLQGIIDKSNRGIEDGVNGQFETAGRYGSGMHAGLLADKIAENENTLRYGDYANERQNQIGAVGTAQNLESGAEGLLNNSAQLPWIGTTAQNGGTTQLSSGYGTRTTTENSGALGAIGGLVGTLGGAAISKYSDERVKDVKRQVGTDPQTGLPIYDYTYKGDPTQTPQTGVMAQDVEQVRPDAVSTDPAGVKMVDYGKIGMPDPAALASLKQNVPQVREKFSVGGLLRSATQPGSAGIGDTVSRIGESLLAGSGGGWGDIGKGLLASRAERSKAADDAREFGLKSREADARIGYYNDRGAAAIAPKSKRTIQLRNGAVMLFDPATGDITEASGAIPGSLPAPKLYATADGYQPASAAVGKAPFVKPAAPPRAGSGTASGLTPAAAGGLRARAALAISRGADPVKVNARLAAMLGGRP